MWWMYHWLMTTQVKNDFILGSFSDFTSWQGLTECSTWAIKGSYRGRRPPDRLSQNQPGPGIEAFILLIYFDVICSLSIHTYPTILHMCTLWGGLFETTKKTRRWCGCLKWRMTCSVFRFLYSFPHLILMLLLLDKMYFSESVIACVHMAGHM